MEWINAKNQKPLAYKTGNWDGKNSDEVIAEVKSGKRYLAHYCECRLDGIDFNDWYDSQGWEINEEIVRYLEIPE